MTDKHTTEPMISRTTPRTGVAAYMVIGPRGPITVEVKDLPGSKDAALARLKAELSALVKR